uniref:MULE transposase domain-containing protein n=1 Tax=Trichogramma kaykai TaxID=54128 RepID=A0ABD2XCH5_9HYME
MFPPSPNSLMEMSLQIGDPRNARLFFHELGFLTSRIFRDDDEDMHFLFYDADIVAKLVDDISTIMLDFTYNVCPVVPNANLQLRTVMCVYRGHAIPVLWFIISRKTTNAYRKMCSLIRELFATSNILMIVTDFELPLRVALRETFGATVYLI